MYETTYHRASSVADAVRIAGESGGEGKFLSGGMTLLPTMKQRLAAPSDLIDLRHVPEMKGIAVDARRVCIGGGMTHGEIAESADIRAVAPGFAELAGLIGDPAVRHMGTIGGSVANNDPAADYPAALLALDGLIHTDRREVPAADFFRGLFETALEEGEIVTAVSFEAPDASAYEKFRNPASRYAMCGAYVARRGTDVRVGVTGAGADGVFRWSAAEQALTQTFDPAALDRLTVDAGLMLSDLHGSSIYRANLVTVVTKRAVAKVA
ncbi:FAD binding domain-containing protein [Mangrovibrevibacter kandeliae]|uniref:FAD binding domain-containing protein n=1 Tax=Mangrovibrevibacter kandeliae TaxID=2968473 RepID=UPI0021193E2E|nr:xanthine dehydrogenase family protein subunit M [Aurantimonas sp. CSK15Z-1]MCQ8782022.1 xanthine dehydrogenase family protein subunit M [Aurantimonas sp. CSK15Z-1]